MGARLSAEELEQRSLDNNKASLVKLKSKIFDEIVENLDFRSFLALKESCKAIQVKCNDVVRGPYLEAAAVNYLEGRVESITLQKRRKPELYKVEGDRLQNFKAQIRCTRLQIPKLGDNGIRIALEYLEKWNLTADRLSTSELSCSPRIFEEVVEKLKISEVASDIISSEIAALPLWNKMNSLATESPFPESILFERNLEYLLCRLTSCNFQTIAQILLELKEGERSLIGWKIKGLPWSCEEFNDEVLKLRDSNGEPVLRKVKIMYDLSVSEEEKYAVVYTTNQTLWINKGKYASYL